jgi:hypothetical protein
VRLGRYGAETLAPKYQAEAKARAEQLAPLIRDFKKRGYSMRGIANELKKRKVQTPRGGAWHPQLVERLVLALEASDGVSLGSASPRGPHGKSQRDID